MLSPDRARQMPGEAGHALTRPRSIEKRSSYFDPYLILVILIALFTIGPLLQDGYPWDAHDARHSVYFLLEFDRGIQDGILYPRWQPDFAFGYGYPFFNIYGPLSTYVAEAFHLIGFGFTDAVKIVLALSVIGSGLAMYGFVKQLFGRPAGLVAAVAYMVIPYRLVDLYVRVALAESLAYLFVPLVLWGVWSTIHRPRLLNIVALASAYAGLIMTHPLTALLLTLILLFYVVTLTAARINVQQPFHELSKESALPLLGHFGYVLAPAAFGLLLGLCLSAISLLPAMTESVFVRLDQWYGGRYAWGGDFVEFFQLFSPRWGFGASVPGPNDHVSFQLGIVPIVLSLFSLVYLLRKPGGTNLERGVRRQIAFFAALTGVIVLLMLGISAPLWQLLPLARLAQFPWRLLAITVVSTSVLSGAVAWRRAETRLPDISTLILVALLVLGSLPYMRAQMSQRQVSLAGLMEFQQSADEMTGSTAWVRRIPTWSPMADHYIAGKPLTSKVNYDLFYRQQGRTQARTLELRSDSELVEYRTELPVLLTFNTFYYPGWHAYLLDIETGKVIEELPIALRGELGLMTVKLPPGVGHVLLRLEDTSVRSLGTAVSFASLVLVVVLFAGRAFFRPRKRRGGKNGSSR